MSGVDLEWLALERALKPALRIASDPDARAGVEARAIARGLAIEPAASVASIGGAPRVILYLARDPALARAARDAEAAILPGGPSRAPDASVLAAHRELGALLGYPSCCVEAFVARVARGVTARRAGGAASEEYVALEDAASRSRAHDARLNVLRRRASGALIAFHPCALDCAPAIDLAERLRVELARLDPARHHALLAMLRGTISLLPDGSSSTGPDAITITFA